MPQRIEYIDVMKGIAILLMVIGHYYLWVPYLPVIIWSFHMPLFIFLNGFFFSPGVEPVKAVKKCFIAYVHPYILVCLILILIDASYTLITEGTIWSGGVSRFISSVYGLASNNTLYRPEYVEKIGAIWFLRALFVGRVLMVLISHYIKNNWIQFTIVLALLVLAVLQTSLICLPIRLNYGCAFLIWIMLGYLYRYRFDKVAFFDTRGGLFLCLIIWMLVVVLEGKYGLYSVPSVHFPLYGLEIVGGVCGILLIKELSRIITVRIKGLSRFFQFFGKISLWVLCVHAVSLELNKYLPESTGIVYSTLRIVCDVSLAILLRKAFSYIKYARK